MNALTSVFRRRRPDPVRVLRAAFSDTPAALPLIERAFRPGMREMDLLIGIVKALLFQQARMATQVEAELELARKDAAEIRALRAENERLKRRASQR